MATKKKNPTDATLRNVRAANQKLRELAARLKSLEQRVKKLERG